jgi:hypothetical protein
MNASILAEYEFGGGLISHTACGDSVPAQDATVEEAVAWVQEHARECGKGDMDWGW